MYCMSSIQESRSFYPVVDLKITYNDIVAPADQLKVPGHQFVLMVMWDLLDDLISCCKIVNPFALNLAC